MNVVRFQTTTAQGRTVYEIDSASGILVFSSITSATGGGQVTLTNVRELALPWEADRAPTWVRPDATPPQIEGPEEPPPRGDDTGEPGIDDGDDDEPIVLIDEPRRRDRGCQVIGSSRRTAPGTPIALLGLGIALVVFGGRRRPA